MQKGFAVVFFLKGSGDCSILLGPLNMLFRVCEASRV